MGTIEEMLAFSERMLTDRASGNVPEIVKKQSQSSTPRLNEGFMQPGEGLSNVEVSDNYVNNILGFNTLLEAAETPTGKVVQAPVQDLSEAQRLEERILGLVDKLTALLREAKVVIKEMTGCGNLGAGVQSTLMFKEGGDEYPPVAKKKKKKKRKA